MPAPGVVGERLQCFSLTLSLCQDASQSTSQSTCPASEAKNPSELMSLIFWGHASFLTRLLSLKTWGPLPLAHQPLPFPSTVPRPVPSIPARCSD